MGNVDIFWKMTNCHAILARMGNATNTRVVQLKRTQKDEKVGMF